MLCDRCKIMTGERAQNTHGVVLAVAAVGDSTNFGRLNPSTRLQLPTCPPYGWLAPPPMPCPQPCWWEQKVLGCRVWATVNGKTVGTGKEFVRWTRRPAGPGYEDTDCSEDSEGDTESDDELVAPDAAPSR